MPSAGFAPGCDLGESAHAAILLRCGNYERLGWAVRSTNVAATRQPRATPWDFDRRIRRALKGRFNSKLVRPFRAIFSWICEPRAAPWADMTLGLWPALPPETAHSISEDFDAFALEV